MVSLQRYRKVYKLPEHPTASKDELLQAMVRHFTNVVSRLLHWQFDRAYPGQCPGLLVVPIKRSKFRYSYMQTSVSCTQGPSGSGDQ
jgi:hypothetical protein